LIQRQIDAKIYQQFQTFLSQNRSEKQNL